MLRAVGMRVRIVSPPSRAGVGGGGRGVGGAEGMVGECGAGGVVVAVVAVVTATVVLGKIMRREKLQNRNTATAGREVSCAVL